MSRVREYEDNAARQRAYRQRLREKKALARKPAVPQGGLRERDPARSR